LPYTYISLGLQVIVGVVVVGVVGVVGVVIGGFVYVSSGHL
jgi:hypothetical protein